MEDIYESGEMYLETILLLKKSKGAVRSIDIVNDLNYAKSSVSRGINILKSKGFITVAEDGAIEFTETGRERAQEIYERHKILTAFLKKLGVSEKTAEADACRMEHVISQESFEVIKKTAVTGFRRGAGDARVFYFKFFLFL